MIPKDDPQTARPMVVTDGNSAVARAAVEAGVRYFSSYPGSPVNTVGSYLAELDQMHQCGITFNAALNEHIAVLAAAGASFCGVRSLVVMKHVGMNIAADPLNYLGYTGVKGGMVIVVGTDPGATCSTGEEDVHWYVPQFNFPLYEPATIKGIRECMLEAYVISERYGLPALVFLPAALCYNSDLLPGIDRAPLSSSASFDFEKNKALYTNVGAQAVRNHRNLIEKVARLAAHERRNSTHFTPAARVGLITRGVTFGHTYEAVKTLGLEDRVHLHNVELVHPINCASFEEFARNKDTLYVIEDQDGFLENQIKMILFNELDCRVHGKEYFPSYGGISIDMVEAFLARIFGLDREEVKDVGVVGPEIPERMGTYCEGCPHRASFFAMEQALDLDKVVIGGDIGCSSLPPHKPDWLMCMNAGISLSQGIGQTIGGERIVSTGGDGSFFHMGLVSLLSAVVNRIDLLHVILDNGTIAMTGHQESPTGKGQPVDLPALLKAMGVKRVVEVNVFKPGDLARALEEERKGNGVRVIWARGACALQPDEAMLERRSRRQLKINNARCGECRLCYEDLQCPAINLVPSTARDLFVDLDRCMRCGVCLEICPNDAIEKIEA